MTIQNAPGIYTPGTQYAMRVLLEDGSNPLFTTGGMQISSLLESDFCQAGVLEPAPTEANMGVDTEPDGTQWLEHKNPKDQAAGQVMWDILWTAPGAGSGSVEMSVCANAASDSDGNENDAIYCTNLTIREGGGTEICDNGVDDDGDGMADCADTADCPDTTPCQDDGMFCNGVETCGGGTCNPSGDPCQPGETCDEPGDQCLPGGVEDCFNGTDDDGDNMVDCNDFDCAERVECTSNACSDGVDNDGNGDTDCADAACAENPDCTPDACTDAMDNDGDGFQDCDDQDCVCGDFTACADRDCDGDLVPNGTDCAPTDGTVWAEPIEVPAFDISKLNQNIACQDPSFTCDFLLLLWSNLDQFAGPGTVYDLMTGATIDLNATPEPYENSVCGLDNYVPIDFPQPPGEVCDDGGDNDGDGFPDCIDPDCAGDPNCPETGNCLDLQDNDGDGMIDCDDVDCAIDRACLPVLFPVEIQRIDQDGSVGTIVQYFLPRAQNVCSTGSYGDSSETPDPRDFLDADGPANSCD